MSMLMIIGSIIDPVKLLLIGISVVLTLQKRPLVALSTALLLLLYVSINPSRTTTVDDPTIVATESFPTELVTSAAEDGKDGLVFRRVWGGSNSVGPTPTGVLAAQRDALERSSANSSMLDLLKASFQSGGNNAIELSQRLMREGAAPTRDGSDPEAFINKHNIPILYQKQFYLADSDTERSALLADLRVNNQSSRLLLNTMSYESIQIWSLAVPASIFVILFVFAGSGVTRISYQLSALLATAILYTCT